MRRPRSTRSPNFLRRSHERFFAVEFDVHGDRQCAAAAGGVNCTVRAFPPGFGLRITDTMETFFDLADVRPAGSPLDALDAERTSVCLPASAREGTGSQPSAPSVLMR